MSPAEAIEGVEITIAVVALRFPANGAPRPSSAEKVLEFLSLCSMRRSSSMIVVISDHT